MPAIFVIAVFKVRNIMGISFGVLEVCFFLHSLVGEIGPQFGAAQA